MMLRYRVTKTNKIENTTTSEVLTAPIANLSASLHGFEGGGKVFTKETEIELIKVEILMAIS